jgi:hypothetical protein
MSYILSALTGSNGLKRDNLLFDPSAFTFRASDFFCFIFRDAQLECKFLFALFTSEIIAGHAKPPIIRMCLIEKEYKSK